MLTADILRAALPAARPTDIARFATQLAEACAEWVIDTPLRQAAFLAQIAHESGQFRVLAENLNYSAEALLRVFPRHFDAGQAATYARQPQRIGSRVYANRMGNGDEASGDGWRYRGRGLIQVTGKANYAACGTALGLDLIAQPDLLEQPGPAAHSAGWFWHRNSLNRPADARDIETITRRINGGLTGLDDRKACYARACAALEVSHEPA
ncbi:glycoside hydrolase family 19 protein [Magnetospirillum gryphiswaldense]|uniref:Chitinase n=1 Tax=Magnetospirillum gryphiswaldense TaxID=55518 RepID=A4TVX0_9PROT|nr:glycoside hydrolase family 19 protein [Magnetospirillum gryphiswaldense]AVM76186.1 Chitinase class I [Magnetospirillum gryphiswaldense MSR-1]AVM80089.1 Chitinase class I [Magnetospirillum gryphiswaldense]CAM74777.1 chitinase [Magnetospirillum gryphiswaldense MSR-1]